VPAAPAEAPPGWPVGAAAVLALAFLATGFGKLLDVPGFAAVLDGYRIWPMSLLLPVAAAVTIAELAIGVGLLRQRWRQRAAIAAAALALGNALLLTLTLLRGLELDNCGCFGVFLARPLRPWTPLEDVALLALALLVRRGPAPLVPRGPPR